MKLTRIIAIFILFAPILTSAQMTIKGQVINKHGEKVIADIYQYGIYLAKDINGDFEIKLDSLGGPYYFSALGYENKIIIMEDTNFLSVVMEKKKSRPRKDARNTRSSERYLNKERKRALRLYNGCCFVSGTMILMADGTEKKIENLNVGDSISSYDFELQSIVVSSILDLDIAYHNNIISVNLENDIKILNTIDHPYYVFGKGICSVDPISTYNNYDINTKQLETGDSCYAYSDGALVIVRVLSIKKVKGNFITYNISDLNNNNNYFANGILVNNEDDDNKRLLTKNKEHRNALSSYYEQIFNEK